MNLESIEHYTLDDIAEIFKEKVDAVLVVHTDRDHYRSVLRKGVFVDIIEENGNYSDLVERLFFRFKNSLKPVDSSYQVFTPLYGKFNGKYSKRLSFVHDDTTHVAQMTVCPLSEYIYMIVLDELDNSECMQEFLTDEKINNIYNTYLYSMYVDLVKDTTNSINIKEISDQPMNVLELKYTEWRMMIVNMIWPEDQPLFLERTEPDYLKKNLAPGRTTSFDCR